MAATFFPRVPADMTKLAASIRAAAGLLRSPELATTAGMVELTLIMHRRRGLDLTDLSPADQAGIVLRRVHRSAPGWGKLVKRLESSVRRSSPLRVKLGIEPQGTTFHLGNLVPFTVADRLRRMGHDVIVVLADDEPAAAAAYRQQLARFLRRERLSVRSARDVRATVSVDDLVRLGALIPLPREGTAAWVQGDAAQRTVADVLYAVVRAADSLQVRADVEIAGSYQWDTMQLARKVMIARGLPGQHVIATELLPGTDGTGRLMSVRHGNALPLSHAPDRFFAAAAAIHRRSALALLRVISEWQDDEIAMLSRQSQDDPGTSSTVAALVAMELTALVYGISEASQVWNRAMPVMGKT